MCRFISIVICFLLISSQSFAWWPWHKPTPTRTPTPKPTATPIRTITPTPISTVVLTATPTVTPSTVTATYFVSASPWNTKISSGTLIQTNSQDIINFSVGTTYRAIYLSMTDYSVPIYFANSTTPLYTVPIGQPSWCPGFPTAVPIPDSARPASGTDGHMTVVDLSNHYSYDFYQAVKTTTGWKTTTGIRWNISGLGYNTPWTGACRAAGTPLLGGIITYNEMKQNLIPHALAMSLPILRNSPAMVSPPAAAAQSGSTDIRSITIGSRVQLNPQYNISSLSAKAQVIARALQDYGAYIVDGSQTPVIYLEDLQYDTIRSWSGIVSNTSITVIPIGQLNVLK